MNWQDIIKFLISVSGLSAIAIYIGKQLVNKTLDAGIEKYRMGLNKELEIFKSELSRTNVEHGIRFSKLHEQRAEKIKLLYTLAYDLERKLKSFTDIMQGPEWSVDTDKSTEVKKCLVAIEEALELNRIYFSDELSKQIETIIHKSTQGLAMMNRARLIDRGILGKKNENPKDTWLAADVYVQNEIYQTRLELVKEFQQIVGVK